SALQPSSGAAFPSSQTSPGSSLPLPHACRRQSEPQLASPSHSSPLSLIPFPQTSRLQFELQPSPSIILPSSHSSLGVPSSFVSSLILPSPHPPSLIQISC